MQIELEVFVNGQKQTEKTLEVNPAWFLEDNEEQEPSLYLLEEYLEEEALKMISWDYKYRIVEQ